MVMAQPPGWYGKLPMLGDFASRRLPPAFIEPWDRWLATELARWRESDEQWLTAFLAAPITRFVIGPGLPMRASPGYAGVLMPSVDRVGRYFPLTVARERPHGEEQVSSPWLQALEGCAIAALQEDWDAERFDSALLGVESSEGAWPDWPAPGQALWWCEREGEVLPPQATQGLPTGPDFIRILTGHFGNGQPTLSIDDLI